MLIKNGVLQGSFLGPFLFLQDLLLGLAIFEYLLYKESFQFAQFRLHNVSIDAGVLFMSASN